MQNARVSLPGAITDAIQREMFNVLTEFFNATNCWTEDIDIPLTVGETDYDIIATEPGTILRLMALVDDNDLPVPAIMAIPGELALKNEPGTTGTLTATVSLTCVDPVKTDGYPQFPDWILNKYYTGILDGILGRMHSQIAKPYSNERIGIYHLRRFRDAMASARTETRNGNLFAGQRWRFPTFAAGTQR